MPAVNNPLLCAGGIDRHLLWEAAMSDLPEFGLTRTTAVRDFSSFLSRRRERRRRRRVMRRLDRRTQNGRRPIAEA